MLYGVRREVEGVPVMQGRMIKSVRRAIAKCEQYPDAIVIDLNNKAVHVSSSLLKRHGLHTMCNVNTIQRRQA